MFEAEFTQGGQIFKKVLESIKDLIIDAQWDCLKSGIQLDAMDLAHISLVSIFLKSCGFSKFKCDSPVTMGMNLSSMYRIIKCAANDDVITIKSDNKLPDIVTFGFASANGRLASYEMKLINLDTEHMTIPKCTYPVVINMAAVEFQRIIKDLCQFGEFIDISASKSPPSITFTVNGDIGRGSIQLQNETGRTQIEIEDNVQLTFTCKYLNLFVKATSLSPTVRVCLSPTTPLMIEYTIDKDIGHIKYYLAPNVCDNAAE